LRQSGRIRRSWFKTVFRRAALSLALASPLLSLAQDFDQGPVFAFIEENDLVVKTDRHYTQGLKVSYLQADNDLPQWVSCLATKIPTFGFTNGANKFGYEIGQNIYTPADLQAKQLLPHDRPYAGWLYTGLILQRRGLAGPIPVLEHFQIDLGVIGPWSLAKESQTWVHELRGFALPQGWSNQLHNEPGLALKYERSWRVATPWKGTWGADFIPRAGTSLGNVDTSFRAAGTLRLGWHLPDDFGVQTVDSLTTPQGGLSYSDKNGFWGFYLFGGFEGKAVLFTSFLDGNLGQASPSVVRVPWVGELHAGFAVILQRIQVGFTYVYQSRTFTEQTKRDSYGSVFLKAMF
jgi:lipid A 3-O-deacylase